VLSRQPSCRPAVTTTTAAVPRFLRRPAGRLTSPDDRWPLLATRPPPRPEPRSFLRETSARQELSSLSLSLSPSAVPPSRDIADITVVKLKGREKNIVPKEEKCGKVKICDQPKYVLDEI